MSDNGKAPRARNRTVVLTPELAGKVRARVGTGGGASSGQDKSPAPAKSETSSNAPFGGRSWEDSSDVSAKAGSRPAGSPPNFSSPPPFASPPPGTSFGTPPPSEETRTTPPPPPAHEQQVAKGGEQTGTPAIPKPTLWGEEQTSEDDYYQAESWGTEPEGYGGAFGREYDTHPDDDAFGDTQQRWTSPPPPPEIPEEQQYEPAQETASQAPQSTPEDDAYDYGASPVNAEPVVPPLSEKPLSMPSSQPVAEPEIDESVSEVPSAMSTLISQKPVTEPVPPIQQSHQPSAQVSNEPVAPGTYKVSGAKSVAQPGAQAVAQTMLLGFLISFDTDPYGEAFELRQGRTIVSSDLPRSGGRVMLLEDSTVASMHAVFKAEQDKVVLLDQLSESTTHIIKSGEEEMELSGDRAIVENGDIVKFGNRSFKVCLIH